MTLSTLEIKNLALRDYLFELIEKAKEPDDGSDFQRGYAMGIQHALESLQNKLESFGLSQAEVLSIK